MPLFRRRGRAEEEDPFLAEVRATLEGLGLEHEIGDGAVHFAGGGQAGLANLEQMWNAAAPADRAELVASHFRQLLAAEARDTESMPADEALPLARLRLWSRDDLPEGFEIVARPYADDLIAAVVLDLPETISSVKPEQAAAWEIGEDELIERAGEQTRADPDLDIERFEHDDGAVVAWAESELFFAATRALWPEDVLGAPPGAHGAIVAVPNRHLVGVHAIEDVRCLGAIQAMLGFAARRYEAGPGSISPHLYWWRPEEVVRLPAGEADGAIQFFPPDEFVQVLNGLAEPDR